MTPRLTESRLLSIYRESIDDLYGYVSRRCHGDRQLAEDITQETWLRAVRHWYTNGAPDNPQAWLTTVARNLLFNHVRRAEPMSLDTADAQHLIEAVGEDATESDELLALLHKALHRLPDDESRLIEDFHLHRQRMTQIAATHGISERAVEGRLRRARARLRRELELLLPNANGDLV